MYHPLFRQWRESQSCVEAKVPLLVGVFSWAVHLPRKSYKPRWQKTKDKPSSPRNRAPITKLREHRGRKNIRARRYGGRLWNSVCWTWFSYTPRELIDVVTRTRQQKFQDRWGRWCSSPTPSVEPLAWIVSEERKAFFSENVAMDRIPTFQWVAPHLST